jgi:hypothetical protein
MSEPRIGVPRIVNGAELPVLYPGERAQAQFGTDAVARLVEGHILAPDGWLVEPMPGWRGLYLRWRYRLLGRWLGGQPKITAEARLTREPDE